MEHPCAGMTKSQVETFERLAVGITPPATKGTWLALEDRGVIQRGPDLIRHDAFGEYRIPQWQVPIHIHFQWCAWCAENVKDDKEKKDE